MPFGNGSTSQPGGLRCAPWCDASWCGRGHSSAVDAFAERRLCRGGTSMAGEGVGTGEAEAPSGTCLASLTSALVDRDRWWLADRPSPWHVGRLGRQGSPVTGSVLAVAAALTPPPCPARPCGPSLDGRR